MLPSRMPAYALHVTKHVLKVADDQRTAMYAQKTSAMTALPKSLPRAAINVSKTQ